MPRSFSLVLALMLATVVAPDRASAQPDAGLARFVHPNAKILINVNWSRIGASQLGGLLREKLGVAAGSMVPGIEFLDDVDRVLLSSPGGTPSDDAEGAPLLLAVGGHFDLAKVRAALLAHGTKPQMFNAYQVFRPQGKNARDMAFVLFDAKTILIGDSHSIFGALERSAYAPPSPDATSILARAASMEANYDASLIVTAPNAFGGDKLHDLLSGQGLDAQPQGFEGGFSLRSGFAADFSVVFASEDAVKAISAQLSKMIKLAARDKANAAALQGMEKKVKLVADGPRLKVSIRLTPQEWAQAVEEGRKRAAAMAAARASRSPMPAVTLSPVSPPVPPEIPLSKH